MNCLLLIYRNIVHFCMLILSLTYIIISPENENCASFLIWILLVFCFVLFISFCFVFFCIVLSFCIVLLFCIVHIFLIFCLTFELFYLSHLSPFIPGIYFCVFLCIICYVIGISSKMWNRIFLPYDGSFVQVLFCFVFCFAFYLSFLLLSGNSTMYLLIYWMVSCKSLRLFIFLHSFHVCSSNGMISIDLAPRWLIPSSTSYLSLDLSSGFFISVIVFFF